MASLPSPEQLLEAKQTIQVIGQLLDELPAREREILEWRFGFEGEPRTLQSIADEIGRSTQRVRQIAERALRKLKSPPKTARLRKVGVR